MIFRRQQKKVEARIGEFIAKIRQCFILTQAAIDNYCTDGNREKLRDAYIAIHRSESEADDIEADIGCMLFSQSLFPESREIILELLDKVDALPDHAESTTRMLLHQHISIPSVYASDISRLLDVCCMASCQLLDTVMLLFSDFSSAATEVVKIDTLESQADQIEAEIIEKIFSDSMDGFEKLLLRDFVQHTSQIADRAEIAGKLILLIVAKRSV